MENDFSADELEDDAQFRADVRKGMEQADRGEFVEEEEMDARIRRMLEPKVAETFSKKEPRREQTK